MRGLLGADDWRSASRVHVHVSAFVLLADEGVNFGVGLNPTCFWVATPSTAGVVVPLRHPGLSLDVLGIVIIGLADSAAPFLCATTPGASRCDGPRELRLVAGPGAGDLLGARWGLLLWLTTRPRTLRPASPMQRADENLGVGTWPSSQRLVSTCSGGDFARKRLVGASVAGLKAATSASPDWSGHSAAHVGCSQLPSCLGPLRSLFGVRRVGLEEVEPLRAKRDCMQHSCCPAAWRSAPARHVGPERGDALLASDDCRRHSGLPAAPRWKPRRHAGLESGEHALVGELSPARGDPPGL